MIATAFTTESSNECARHASAGFSMVEVLVSLVLVSVGLLGTAKLTTASLQSTNNSYYRSQATFLANDILDRMRANLPAARSGGYNIAAGPSYSSAASTVAGYDSISWVTTVASTLPNGVGTVSVDGAGIATITINWDGNDVAFTTSSRL